MNRFYFESGTVCLAAPAASEPPLVKGASWDTRVGAFRAEAMRYRDWLTLLVRAEVPLCDEVRAYDELALVHRRTMPPRGYQSDAVAAWERSGRRGLIVLPTGAGKTYVAEMCIARAQRSTLVCVPTIELLFQWHDRLQSAFGEIVGVVGGGEYEPRPITVITYQSAGRMIDHLGARFGLLICDECHHLPSPAYSEIARCSIAPFRLGLSATPERADQGHALFDELLGPEVFRREVDDLAGRYLSSYEQVPITVSLDPIDAELYRTLRGEYLSFLRERGLRMRGPADWGAFVAEASRSKRGRRAFRAFREQRRIAFCAPAKLRALNEIFGRHADARILVFTNDNDTVYRISRAFLLPALTHRTPGRERKELLERFRDGRYPCLVTSRVLNEGVDVPEANVAVVVSGTSSTREQIQRLGRILRPQEGKQARLYELITGETVEVAVSERRRSG
ncbi:MAG: DEAD/DEAH box helicase family protein [Myxococcales bacterium]|nr:DEAD/DEAH box helicase family protein [Myxococcales bacterium]